jgi:hypothetical protein
MISGAHTVIYSADTDQAFFRDGTGLKSVEAGRPARGR